MVGCRFILRWSVITHYERKWDMMAFFFNSTSFVKKVFANDILRHKFNSSNYLGGRIRK